MKPPFILKGEVRTVTEGELTAPMYLTRRSGTDRSFTLLISPWRKGAVSEEALTGKTRMRCGAGWAERCLSHWKCTAWRTLAKPFPS